MKYILILMDGMADYPLEALNGKTPLEAASTPCIDKLAKHSEIGTVRTVPDGFKPASDVANLGVLGYDVNKCYTGRSPLEALSLGINMKEDDLVLRANLVTLSDDEPFDNKIMLDYSGGEISTEEANILLDDLKQHIDLCGADLYAGMAYRHCLIVHHASPKEKLTPPHDIIGQNIKGHMPDGELSNLLGKLIISSNEFLKNHPINKARILSGKLPANALWFWGEGTKPNIQNFESLYGKRGAMVSAVDLLKGIAIGGGMKSIDVEGATGKIDTNYSGKAAAAIEALKDNDFCMVHIEATDECGHQGDALLKTKAIELIDEKIVAPIYENLKNSGEDFAMLIMPDHYTPTTLRTHSGEPVPYMLYASNKAFSSGGEYSEKAANESPLHYDVCSSLTKKFLSL